MRYFEIFDGIGTLLSKEESKLLDRITESESGRLLKSDLNIRDKEVARKMVSRGVLNGRSLNEDEDYEYTSNGLTDLWRDL